MDDYERALHSAILQDLRIKQPPYLLKVDSDAGGALVELRDASNVARNDPSGGTFIHSLRLEGDMRAANVLVKAKEAADAIRPHLK